MIETLRLPQKYHFLVYLLFGVIATVVIVTPVIAQEILQTTLNNMQESDQWWDKLWKDTFDPSDPTTSISIYTFATASRFFLGIGLLIWVFQYGQKMAESRGLNQSVSIFAKMFFPVFLAVLFLNNQAYYSRVLAYGLRDIIDSWSVGAMEMQVAGVEIRSALTDQLVTQEAKQTIQLQAQKCQQMPQPSVILPSLERPGSEVKLTLQQEQAYQYLECLAQLEKLAKDKKEEALNSSCPNLPGLQKTCASFSRFMDKIIDSAQKIREYEGKKRTNNLAAVALISGLGWADLFTGMTMASTFGPILSFTQWLWTSFLEMALWLSGLFAPLFIAVSIIPGKQNLFVAWLIGFVTIGMAKLAYVMVIGIVAIQLTSQTTLLSSDLRFPMALGLFAPGVSLAVVTAGGLAAAQSFQSQSIAVVSTAVSVAGSAFSTVASSAARMADKRR
ncbi:hypothetical protein [Chroococcus sp. FPU101]|uniref:hypothetical protein n=1 Tax=Chroococcus sp. FPU101 TaxID=1974212 RepID=UPI001A8C2BC0|nr:hypothetical protein [Chroococcus sp. FPU101]GFE72156.1 hypothetical protein CFPU101_47660 [Chroococcus sp. FPU101]